MVLSELRALQSNYLGYDLDNYLGESPGEDGQNGQINRALRVISKECFLFDPKVTFTVVAGQFRYSLDDRKTPVVSKRIVRPHYVTINGNKLWNADQTAYGVWGWQEFVHSNPKWEASSSGTPTKAVLFGAREVLLHLPPTAAVVSAGENFIAGQVLANDLVNDTDDPSDQGVPVEIHEAIAYLAAVYASEPNVTEQEGWVRVGRYDSQWTKMVRAIRNENRRLFDTGRKVQSTYADVIRL